MRCANDVIYGRARARHGLGETTFDQNKGLIQFGLSQIPYVGPALSAVAGLLDPLFGWGDPNSQDDLYTQIINGRIQLAEMRKQLGIADWFEIPPGYDGDSDERADLGTLIVNEYLHRLPLTVSEDLDEGDWSGGNTGIAAISGNPNHELWQKYLTSDRRQDNYNVLAALKSDVQKLQTQAASMMLSAPVPPPAPMPLPAPMPSPAPASSSGTVSQGSGAQPTQDPAPVQVASLETAGPWILGGGVAMLALFAVISASSRR